MCFEWALVVDVDDHDVVLAFVPRLEALFVYGTDDRNP